MFGNILVVAVVFAILIFIHELGHLLACKASGIKVEKFALGFGPALVKWKKAETTYMVCAVPLGGYIKMEGEDFGSTGFFTEPLGKKILVLVTGPGFNLVLGFVLMAILFAGFGMRTPAPRIAPAAGSPAEASGLEKGDLVLSLNGDTVRSFFELDSLLLEPESSTMTFRVRRGDQIHTIRAFGIPESLGIDPFYPPVVGAVRGDGPAARSGMKPGDLILSVDTLGAGDTTRSGVPDFPGAPVPITDWSSFTRIVRAHAEHKLAIRWLRGADTMAHEITPRLGNDMVTGEKVGQIGIEVDMPRVPIPLLTAIWEAVKRTGIVVVKTFVILYQLVTGQISARAVSGPVMVAKIAYEGAQWGLEMLLALWAMLSINLFVVNMLPVPFLDGGRAMLFVVEGIRRKKFTVRQWDFALRIGLHLVVLLVVFALSNDFLNIANLKAESGAATKRIQLGLIIAYAIYAIYDLVRPQPPARKP
jgi:regulator of sigma E protease